MLGVVLLSSPYLSRPDTLSHLGRPRCFSDLTVLDHLVVVPLDTPIPIRPACSSPDTHPPSATGHHQLDRLTQSSIPPTGQTNNQSIEQATSSPTKPPHTSHLPTSAPPADRFVALSLTHSHTPNKAQRSSKARPGPNSSSHQPIRHLISGRLPFWAIRVSSNILGSGALRRGNSPRFPSSCSSGPPNSHQPPSPGQSQLPRRQRRQEPTSARLLIVPRLHPSICTPRSWIGDPVTPHRIRIILHCTVSHLLLFNLSVRHLSSDLLVSAGHSR